MNLNCPDCDGRLRDDGKCDRCSTRYEDTAKGPDPYEIAGGLDLRAAENARYRATVRARTMEQQFAERGEKAPWKRPRSAS